jgi:hypothetical protein
MINSRIASNHYIPNWIAFKTNEEEENGSPVYYVAASGVAILDEFKAGDSKGWRKDKVSIKVPLDIQRIEWPERDGFKPIFGVKRGSLAYVSLNSIYNKNVANDSGHAVDKFYIKHVNPNYKNQGLQDPIDFSPRIGTAFVEADIAVRDSDAYLYRVGFKVEVLVYIEEWMECHEHIPQ